MKGKKEFFFLNPFTQEHCEFPEVFSCHFSFLAVWFVNGVSVLWLTLLVGASSHSEAQV